MNSKKYTIDNEQLARFAKAMGHPARITILEYLASLDCCYFGDIHNELPHCQSNGFAASERIERGRTDTG